MNAAARDTRGQVNLIFATRERRVFFIYTRTQSFIWYNQDEIYGRDREMSLVADDPFQEVKRESKFALGSLGQKRLKKFKSDVDRKSTKRVKTDEREYFMWVVWTSLLTLH